MPILKARLASAAMGFLLFSVLLTRPCLAAGPPPVITVPPLSQIVLNQGSAIFLVVATSGTTISYQWLKNGVNIAGANQSSYIIASAQASDQASYSVKVTNAGGSVTSANATLTVVFAPGITTQPQSQTVTAGQNASYSVVANGTATLSYQWRFNGTALSGATNSVLSLSNVQTNNAGSYTLAVANLYGSITSAVAVLTVNVPPGITTQPQGTAAVVGQNASFSAVANGTAPLSYRWRFNGATLAGATSTTLALPGVQATNAGSYTLVVTNVAGSVTSAVATLTVYVPAGITTQPLSQVATAGQNASFSVVPSGTAPFTYQWNYNGKALTGATSSALILSNVQPTNAGSYTVVAANSWGSTTSAVATLTVNLPPSISAQPQSQAVPVGQTASFSVLASGTATLRYQWRFNGAALAGATTSALTRANVQAANAGSYTVVVTNSAGSVTSAVATLTVLVPPAITAQPVSQTVTQGLNASLVVTVSGTAPFGYQWQFSGTNLAGATNATLMLTNMQLVQAGTYVVTVTNLWGTVVSSPAFLTVIPPPGSDRPLAQGLVAHLTFDTDLSDASGRGNHATAVGKPNLVPGFIGAGSFNPYTQDGTNNYATLGTDPDFSFGKNTDFSIAFWARLPAGGWNGDPAYSDPAFISNKDWSNGNNVGWVVATGSDGRLQWNYTEGGGQPRKDFDGSAGLFGNPGWHHVAVTFQRGANATTYLDGVPVSTNSIAPGNKSIDTGLPTNIGNDGTGSYSPGFGYWTNVFANPTNGLAMDDLGIWRRALAANEIAAIYNVGLAGQDLATVTSANLTPVVRPRIIQSPVSLGVTAGGNAAFTVTANGTAPFAYQWYGNGVPIQGGTGPSLIISNVQPRQAGDYWVVITNAAGNATSSVATLTVAKPTITLSLADGAGMTPAGFTFQFSMPAGLTYVILASTDLQNWIPILTNVAPSGSIVFTDTEAKNYNTRLYRLMVAE